MRSVLIVLALSAAMIIMAPAAAKAAAGELHFSGWIPYWSGSKGIKDARSHLRELDEINPFGYSVKNDGSLNDLMKIKKSTWQKLIKDARKKGVKVIPTVMWSNTEEIHRILSNADLREAHLEAIVREVRRGKFDGIDIDYEGKLAETKDYFSLFLTELKEALGNKTLSCTIEARTPPASLYQIIPAELKYANDYQVISQVCDIVKIMTYDQRRADLQLNKQKTNTPYVPVADVDWVRKVIEFTAQSIPKNKLMIGVATYGYEYEVVTSPHWYQSYNKIWSLNPNYGWETAAKQDLEPTRNNAGELSYSYLLSGSPWQAIKNIPVARGTAAAIKVAAQALIYANNTGQTLTFNYVTWSDAEAIRQKIELAKELGVRGIAIFKIDGGEDQGLWDFID